MGIAIQIKGIVQGVGFRPHVWKLATSLGLKGFVRNDADGVTIEIEGENTARFIEELKANPPPLSKITEFKVTEIEPRMGANGRESEQRWNATSGRVLSTLGDRAPPKYSSEFKIVESDAAADKTVQMSPDISICADCERELFDKSDRRHRYPFINCVNCGPRYSIIKELPYDRPNTSMAEFKMCADCAREYGNPADRRYHAQPVACPVCGPKLWFHNVEAGCHSIQSLLSQAQASLPSVESSRFVTRQDAASTMWEDYWAELIEAGKIVAVKGIGGFHLVCDALNAEAVAELRLRKARENKPFALMVPDLEWAHSVCELSLEEDLLLTSRERPIVLLRLKADFETRDAIAPNLNTLGVMLPYTPMHLLMLNLVQRPLVMTSANYTDEPMIHANAEALETLADVADEFLLHDREIVNRCDDSVAAVYGGQTIVLRPGRGLAPFSLPAEGRKSVLAIGADMKNTFAVAHGGHITLSPYIGDLENPETQEILKTSVWRYLNCYDVKPEIIVYDLHPDYFSTRIAEEFAAEFGVPQIAVQHHYAHCLAAAAEHGIEGRAVGIAFDGTGYGIDGTIWGGEILEFDSSSFERKFHLKPFALPGGERAVKEPRRTLISILSQVDTTSPAKGSVLAFKHFHLCLNARTDPSVLKVLESGINCPMTSSMGRLFDAAAVLLGVCECPTFDGEGPMRLEAIADPEEQGVLPFNIDDGVIDWRPMFRELINVGQPSWLSRQAGSLSYVGEEQAKLSAQFHNTIAEMVFECIKRLNDAPVLFSGGVFQNRFLTERIKKHPAFDESRMFFSSYPNDSAIALGQAVFGLSQSR